MIVIYTGDIKRENVSQEYDLGAVKMNMECAFLSELDSEGVFQKLKRKVERNEKLDDEELMEFIILPLSCKKKEAKQESVKKTVELAARIKDRGQQMFALAGILAFTDKIIDHKTANKIRRAIEMTQVAQIFEEEKRQALKNTSKQIVIRMIKKNYPSEEIAALVSSYSQDDVDALRRELETGVDG